MFGKAISDLMIKPGSTLNHILLVFNRNLCLFEILTLCQIFFFIFPDKYSTIPDLFILIIHFL